jgi:hypothetical protein
MDNMTENVSVIKKLDDSVPCYTQIYSNKLYIVDLNTPNIACTPPINPSTSYTYRTYKFKISGSTGMYLYKQGGIGVINIRVY